VLLRVCLLRQRQNGNFVQKLFSASARHRIIERGRAIQVKKNSKLRSPRAAATVVAKIKVAAEI
jgi:hypothetical protein